MKATPRSHAKYIKFGLYALIVILINIAGIRLFFRGDLTQNGIYSLSPISVKVAETLTEPLTVKVFFTRDLPAPHNTTEIYLRDLLGEYALNNQKYFRVHFYDVSPETEGVSEAARENQQMARDYGIHPVQIQIVEQDELKFKQAYMGLVMIHGDIVERIPTISTTEGLEYQLTTAIQKLNHKVSALLALDGNIKATLVLSSDLFKVAPYMNLKHLDQYPDEIKGVVDRMKAKTYGKLEFERIDPSRAGPSIEGLDDFNLLRLQWPDIEKANIAAGQGTIGMLLQYKDKTREIPLMRVVRVPIFGDQYQLTSVEELEDLINTNIERLININEDVGYLTAYGTLDIGGGSPLGPQEDGLNLFGNLLNKTYTVKPIDLKEETIAPGLKSMVIVRPIEKMSDYDLYQIDQALMRGTNLALFIDAFEEKMPANQGPFMSNQMPTFVPLDTGLEQMLAHYGVRIKQAVVLDEKCHRQVKPRQQGGGEQPIYFIPKIESANINKELDYLKNIKGLFAYLVSPLELDSERIAAQEVKAHELFASSERSWEMRDRIVLNPMFLTPPASDTEMARRPLAYLLEGTFTSYFKGKPMPEKPAEDDADTASNQPTEETAADADKPIETTDLSQIQDQGGFRETGVPAKIFVVASSKMLSDQLLDESGQSPNTMFVLNMIDALNDREAVAAMRSKEQRFNPLAPTTNSTKVLIKSFNMVGLPILVVGFGLLVWWRRHARRKMILQIFAQ